MPRMTDVHISLDAEDVLEGQGIDPGRARSAIVDAAQEILAALPDLLGPAAVYDVFPVRSFHHKTIELNGGGAFEGPLVARALAGAEKVAVAICTIGPALEERMNQLFAEDPVKAMALDGAGVSALREISRVVVDEVREIAVDHGWGWGMRAQPGQEGWSIWQQRVIFEHLPADEIRVRLTDSCLMIPRKSVSFVIGMGPHMRPDAVACDYCSKRARCPWRVEA
ncbi:MAG: hypothetical protein PVG71_08245 [Anaerolineae bacterium]